MNRFFDAYVARDYEYYWPMRNSLLNRVSAFVCLLSLCTAHVASEGQKRDPSASKRGASHQKPPEATAESSRLHWEFNENKDPMTDEVRLYLAVYGTVLDQNPPRGTQPLLLLGCERDRPRTVIIDLDVMLDDSHPEMRIDSAPSTRENWLMPNDTATHYYKDDSVSLPSVPHLPSRVENPVHGAEDFVRSLVGHSKLLVRARTADQNEFRLVAFDISGLVEEMAKHTCSPR